jgi:hypothetical protein
MRFCRLRPEWNDCNQEEYAKCLLNSHLPFVFLISSLVGKVKVVVDKNRVDGSRVRLAEVEVGDETGVVSLRARDQQIDIVQPLSSSQGAVVLRNCTLELYQGKHIRLAITKWGKLSRYPDNVPSTPPPPSKLNRDRNFSFIDLSKVASEMIPFSSLSIQSPSDLSHSPYGKQHQQQYGIHPDTDHHAKQSGHQQQQRRNKSRGKQPNIKQQQPQHQHSTMVTNSSVAGTHPPGVQYQLIDHGMAGSANIRYNHHSVPQSHAQIGLATGPYGVANVYSSHPHQQSITSTSIYQQQHFQYRQIPDNVASTGQTQHHQHLLYQHHQQQQQQYELQQRHMQQLYQQQVSPDRGGIRNQIPSQVMTQPRTGPYHVQGPYITGAPVTRLGPGGSSVQYYQQPQHPHHQLQQQQQQQQSFPQQYMQQRQATMPNPSVVQTMLNPNDPNIHGTMNPTATSYDPARQSHHRKPTK